MARATIPGVRKEAQALVDDGDGTLASTLIGKRIKFRLRFSVEEILTETGWKTLKTVVHCIEGGFRLNFGT